MSPRPRKVSDAEVFAAAQRVMARCGPGELSLAEIASEAGVTAGALVQRFGSKRQLLVATVERWGNELPSVLEGIRERHHSPLVAVERYAMCMAAMGETPTALASHLAYLQLDLADPDLVGSMRKSAEGTRTALEGWLAEAVAAGELHAGTDPCSLARLVEATVGGSLLSWAVHREGTAAAWVRLDLERLLAPYLA